MSLRDDDDRDALIDRVAHDLTAGDPPASLAENVRARIGNSDRGRWFVGWRPVTAVAALAVAIATAAALWPERPVNTPVVATHRPVAANDGPAVADEGPATAGHDVPDETPPQTPETHAVAGFHLRQGSGGQVSRPVTTSVHAPLLPAIESLDVPAIDDPVLVAEMSGLAMPIEIEPLQIAPLELQ